jgi:molybdopterin molybdotransferase
MQASTYPLLDAGEVAALVLERTPVLAAEELPLADCWGRVLAEDLVAPSDLPPFPTSAVDGYAVRAADGGGRLEVVGESAAGRPFPGPLPARSAVRILTGAVLPDGADCVVMVEDTRQHDGWVEVPADPEAGRNFNRVGDDVRRGERVLQAGEVLGPAELGLAAALGFPRLRVHRRPRVALLTTGDELVEVGRTPGPGQIVDSNRWALLGALQEAGAEVSLLGIAPDEPVSLRVLVQDALRAHDVLVSSGGVSVGSHDLVKPLLEQLGEVHVGRVRLKPGKPFTFATLPEGRLAFGLPGFPVSSLVTFEVFVRPALRKMQGHRALQRPRLRVRLGYEARAAGDRTEYQRVMLVREDGEFVARTTGSQSSSRLLSLVGAHALVRVPPGNQGIPAGTMVDAIVLSLPA